MDTYTRVTEMPVMRYCVNGNPTPLQRPRYTMGRRPYDAQKALKHEFKYHIELQHGNTPFYTGPVMLLGYFFFQLPKMRLVRKEKLINTPHTQRPDADNLMKYISDCCEGILYRDDSIVFHASAIKVWSDVPRTEFIVIPIDPNAKVHPNDLYLQYQLPGQQ